MSTIIITQEQKKSVKRIADLTRKAAAEEFQVEFKPTTIYNAFAVGLGYSSWSELSIRMSEHISAKPSYETLPELMENLNTEEMACYMGKGSDKVEQLLNWEMVELEITRHPPIAFFGRLVGRDESSPSNGSGYYSGRTGRWKEFEIYMTEQGNYVGYILNGTQWNGNKNEHYVKVVKDRKELERFFGKSKLAHELYAACGMDLFDLDEDYYMHNRYDQTVADEEEESFRDPLVTNLYIFSEITTVEEEVPLSVLKAYLFGEGDIEGFNTFSEYLDDIQPDEISIKSTINDCLSQCDKGFEYYGDDYYISTVSDEQMKELVEHVKELVRKDLLEQIENWDEQDVDELKDLLNRMKEFDGAEMVDGLELLEEEKGEDPLARKFNAIFTEGIAECLFLKKFGFVFYNNSEASMRFKSEDEFEAAARELENSEFATRVNFRGDCFNWAWFVDFKDFRISNASKSSVGVVVLNATAKSLLAT